MKTLAITTLATALVISGSAFGQSNVNASHDKKQTKTKVLRDNQMDNVTAAGEESSALAANNSHVTETNSGTVSLSGSALSSATGVNIVSESDALVGNGVNVYSGTLTSQGSSGSADVKQGNEIIQSSKETAKISGYSRGANSQLNVTSASDSTKSSSSKSSLDTSLDKASSHDQSLKVSSASDHSSSSSYKSSNSGAAGASSSNAASLSVKNSAANSSSESLSAAGAFSTHPLSGSASLHASASEAADEAASLSASKSSDKSWGAEHSSSLSADKANSSASAASLAASESDASRFSTSLSKSDSKSSSSHVVKSYDKTYDVQGAVGFDNASAQNVAVDGSTVSATNNYSVSLAGSAMQNATALNIVNAAGGMVANGVNIARTSNMTTTPVLTQVNAISQTR